MPFLSPRFFVQAPPSGALALLSGEADGLAIDATTSGGTVAVKSTGDPTDNLRNVTIAASPLTNAGTSSKWVVNDSGVLVQALSGTVVQEYVAAASQWAIICEAERTNLALQSNDFTNASWTKSNMTTAKTATGPDNVSNSASTLTATAGNATALQAITSGSLVRVTSMWVKRRTGSGTINITHNNGSTWTAVTVTAGWTKVSNPETTASNPTVGVRIVTNGDAIDVYGFQHEADGSTHISPSSTIPTTTVTVTRASDDIAFLNSKFPWSNSTGSGFIWFKFLAPDLDNLENSNTGLLNSDIDGRIVYANIGTIRSYDGTNAPNALPTGSNRTFKAASSWGGNLSMSADAGAVVSTAFDGTMGAGSSLHLGSGTGGTFTLNGYIYQVIILNREWSDGELQAITT